MVVNGRMQIQNEDKGAAPKDRSFVILLCFFPVRCDLHAGRFQCIKYRATTICNLLQFLHTVF
jgi:hypothetical protein